MATPIRVGILGCGNIAESGHAPMYAADERAQLVAVADQRLDRARALAAAYGATAHGTLRELLDQGLDAISVCVHNRYHAEATIEALEAGCHVLCEKPPAMNEREAKAMADAAERTGRLLLYGLVYRHMMTITPFLDQLGSIYLAEASWVRRRGIPGWGPYGNRAAQGGGAMIDLGVHVLDLAWWMLGCPEPTWVLARTSNLIGRSSAVGLLGPIDPATFEVEDTAAGTVHFPAAQIMVHAAFAANVARDEAAQLDLRGHMGGLRIPLVVGQRSPEDYLPTLHSEEHGMLTDTTISRPYPRTVRDGYRLQVAHFVDCILGLAEPIVTPRQGVILQRMVDGFYESAERGEPVNLSRP